MAPPSMPAGAAIAESSQAFALATAAADADPVSVQAVAPAAHVDDKEWWAIAWLVVLLVVLRIRRAK